MANTRWLRVRELRPVLSLEESAPRDRGNSSAPPTANAAWLTNRRRESGMASDYFSFTGLPDCSDFTAASASTMAWRPSSAPTGMGRFFSTASMNAFSSAR